MSGTEWKRQADQLRPRVPTETTVVSEPQPQGDLQDISDPSTGDSSGTTPSQSSTGDSKSNDGAGTPQEVSTENQKPDMVRSETTSESAPSARRYPSRERKPPDRLDL